MPGSPGWRKFGGGQPRGGNRCGDAGERRGGRRAEKAVEDPGLQGAGNPVREKPAAEVC